MLKRWLLDDRGSSFVENGLWIGLIVLTMAGAGYTLANTLKDKYSQIDSTIKGVTVPKIGN